MAAAGRWSLTGMPRASAALPGAETGPGGGVGIEGGAELAARVLLDRLFRRLCTREPWLPPWRELVAVYRRGEERGGRFLVLASGEQFALPEAVGLCARCAAAPSPWSWCRCPGADPLNLAVIVTPGGIVPGESGRVLYLDGVPIASQSGREVHMSEALRPRRRLGSPQGAGAARDRGHPAGWWPQTRPHAGRGYSVTATVACAPYAPVSLEPRRACSARHTVAAGATGRRPNLHG